MLITCQTLRDAGYRCEQMFTAFWCQWPDGAETTEENLRLAVGRWGKRAVDILLDLLPVKKSKWARRRIQNPYKPSPDPAVVLARAFANIDEPFPLPH